MKGFKWIRTLLVALMLPVFVAGCAVDQFTVHKKPVTEMTLQEKALAAVDQMDAVIIATAQTAYQYREDKLITLELKDKIYKELAKVRDSSNEARRLASIGNLEGSNAQLKLAEAAIQLLKSELAKEVQKQEKEKP